MSMKTQGRATQCQAGNCSSPSTRSTGRWGKRQQLDNRPFKTRPSGRDAGAQVIDLEGWCVVCAEVAENTVGYAFLTANRQTRMSLSNNDLLN